VSRYQKGKTNLDFTEARDSEWQWHQLGRMQVSISLQTDNHTSTPQLSFLQAGCPSCRPTNSVKALEEHNNNNNNMGSILPGVLKNKKIIIMMITGRHLEQRGGVVEATGTTHLTH